MVTSVFDETGAKMVGATRRIFYHPWYWMGGTIGTIKYLRPHFQPDVRRGTFSKSTPIYGGGTLFGAFSIRPHFQRYYLKIDPIFSGTIFQIRPPFQRYYFSISTPFSGPQNDQNDPRTTLQEGRLWKINTRGDGRVANRPFGRQFAVNC